MLITLLGLRYSKYDKLLDIFIQKHYQLAEVFIKSDITNDNLYYGLKYRIDVRGLHIRPSIINNRLYLEKAQ